MPANDKEIEKLRKQKKKAETNNNYQEVATICNYIGELLSKQGNYDDAIEEHEMELALCESTGDVMGSAVANRKIGECYCELAEFDKAIRHQQRHLDRAKSCSDDVEEQRAWATLGRTYLCQSEAVRGKKSLSSTLKKAENAFLKALEVANRLRSKISERDCAEMKARLLLNLGLVCDTKKEVERCVTFLTKAIALTDKYNFHEDGHKCMFSLCGIYIRAAKFKDALPIVEKSIHSCIKGKLKALQCEAVIQKAKVLVGLQEYQAAKRTLKTAYKLASAAEKDDIKRFTSSVFKLKKIHQGLSKATSQEEKMKLYDKMGDLTFATGVFSAALQNYHKMLTLAKEINAPKETMIPIYVSLAQTYCDIGQHAESLEYYQEELRCRKGDHEQCCRTWLNIAEAQENMGDEYTAILKSIHEAYICAKEAKLEKLQIHCLRTMCATQENFGRKVDKEKTCGKLMKLYDRYGLTSDDELSEPEEESQKEESEIEDIMDEITDSDESENEEFDREQTTTGRKKTSRFTFKRNEKGETPLHRACIEGNLKRVKKLLDSGHPVNPRDHAGWLPLHEACNYDYVEIVRTLIDHGANVNDRGGERCDGVTPLHDACNCGNLATIKLLIEKGANVNYKDDQTNTALDCLILFRERSDAAEEEKKEIRSVEKMLLKKMGNKQNPPRSRDRYSEDELPSIRRSRSQQTRDTNMNRIGEADDSDDGSVDSFRIVDDNPPIRNSRKPASAPPIVDEVEDLCDDELVYSNPRLDELPELTRTGGATKAYRDAMKIFGSSAQRISLQTQHVTDIENNAEDAPALVNEAEYDSWLVDDLAPVNYKRKRPDANVDNLFKTMGTRKKRREDDDGNSKKTTRVEEKSQRSRERGRRSNENLKNGRDMVDSQNGIFNDCDIIMLDSRVPFSGEDNEIHFEPFPNDEIIDLDLPVISNTARSTSLARQTQQLRLTAFMSSNSPAHMNSNSTSGYSSGDGRGDIGVRTETSALPPVPAPVSLHLRIKVKILEELLLIPVPNNDGTKTMSWLIDEVVQRYYNLHGLRPIISLKTKDGAMLSPDDFVSFVLDTNEELEATFQGWDLKPLKNRYKEACQVLNAIPYRNIQNSLEEVDVKRTLSLEYLGLSLKQMHPILRAVQCQTTLKELHLCGNKIDDQVMNHLASALKTLVNLTVLDLMSNSITAEGLRPLVQMFQDAAASPRVMADRPLHILDSLSLSHNPLGDGSTQSLAQILHYLPSLSKMSISSCDLTAKFFQQHRPVLTESFQGSSLEMLDVSFNEFGFLGIDILLKTLNPRKLLILNIGHTIPSPAATIGLGIHIENYIKQESCNLQVLNIEDCYLTEENIDCLLRGLVQSRSLRSLNASHNKNIKTAEFTALLQQTAQSQCLLESLELSGTGITGPLDTDFLDALGDKLNSTHPLQKVVFTCESLDNMDADSLNHLWRSRWDSAGQCLVKGSSVSLNVRIS
ncbi:tonsoku-like protein [Lineus longissimus]|uniref:tonsoku-like protein n=1 Tax=Lineus longissimus TaxID=88925 RepID=UPI002B4E1291